ncbi:MAG TPA: HNH endonuclease, partial [Bacillota bacterium]|nr:HNH endonuclease [Bacillota bacterium]
YKDTKIKPLTEDEIFDLLDEFKKIIPQGSPMYGIGNNFQYVSLGNCFVIDSPEDSYGGICRADEEIAQISKRRGGGGIDISNLRPNKMPTSNAAKTSTGILPFESRFSNTVREVGQFGRRGALLISLSIHHPECVILWDENIEGKPYNVNLNHPEYGLLKISSEQYNPNKKDFVTSKYDPTKVTGANISVRLTDEFLEAVEKGTTYEQRWPVDSDVPKISKQVDARKVWDKIINSAWLTADPGLLFFDNITKESIGDCYENQGMKTISTNPCITGDTLVYVADGRGNIPIKQLAEEDKDVDVFCYNKKDRVEIRTMRHPRKTGEKVAVYKITLDDGSVIKTTKNHKFRLLTGEYKEVNKLKSGDSLKILTRYEGSIKDIFGEKDARSQDYFWINNGQRSNKAEHRVIAKHYYGKIKKGEIIHHKDRNAQNNSKENLEVITKNEHDKIHVENMMGDKNPMRRAKTEWSEKKWEKHRKNISKAVSAENNPRYTGFTHDEVKQHAILLTKKLERRFSRKEWYKYAQEIGLPLAFSKYRISVLGDIEQMSKQAAKKCEILYINEDPRTVKTFQKIIKQGYNAKIIDNSVIIEKKCERCGKIFTVSHLQRERSFCGQKCGFQHALENGGKEKAMKNLNIFHASRAEKTKEKQIIVFNELKFKLDRVPMMSEWEQECKKKNIPCRLHSKHSFKNYKELKELASNYNHKVVSVEFCGYEDVYNGTVDQYHNFFVGAFESKTRNHKNKWQYLNNLNCGELPLPAYSSCRLLLLNLFGFVKNPFTKEAHFDYEEFYDKVKIAQKLMDDLIDLEEEALTKIIKKIKTDPEKDEIKFRELNLWKKILDTCKKDRRTGTGITALGDTIAALNIGYGTKKGIETVGKIYQTLKFAAFESSADMAKEIGPFPIWNHEQEKDNPFLNRIKNETIELSENNIISGEKIWGKMKKYGRRNIALLTTSPAGSVSLLAKLINKHGTSSGIEPQYAPFYTRKKKINAQDEGTRVDSIDQNGDKWQHFTIYPAAIQEWMEITGETDLEKSPWHNSCALNLDWESRLKVQAAAQKNTDNSLSSTVNLPKDTTVETVKQIYTQAWKLGLKGVTIYRDGCRTGVLTTENQTENCCENKIEKNKAPKRPKELKCDIHHTSVRGEEYFVVVGLFGENNDPYEVFAGKNGNISKKYKNAILRKAKRGQYKLILDEENNVENIIDFEDAEEEAMTRMISTSLRHGADISFIVHQLEKTKGDLTCFAKSVARTLK